MNKPLYLLPLILLSLFSIVRADDQTQPSTQPAIALPPGGGDDSAANALKNSTRHGEWVEIDMPDSTTKIKTFVVYPERADKAPVVVVIHEIFGMTDWVQGVADQLAANGFIALAPDLLSGMGPNGGGTESLDGNVGQTIMKISRDEQAKRLDAVRAYGLALPSATAKNACIGFCWGGGASFAYAVHQTKLDAAVVYYGTPPASEDMAKIACPVLGCYGQNDARITATVDATKQAMAALDKPYFPNIYDGAGHGFLRQHVGPMGPANLKASEQAWPTTIEFLKKYLETN
jgi:carboxymethylenebutenolidase